MSINSSSYLWCPSRLYFGSNLIFLVYAFFVLKTWYPFSMYADDTQIYLPLGSNERGLDTLLACLAGVRAWMSLHFLHLNEGKTENIVFESSETVSSPCLKFVHSS